MDKIHQQGHGTAHERWPQKIGNLSESHFSGIASQNVAIHPKYRLSVAIELIEQEFHADVFFLNNMKKAPQLFL
jgi:hypothetical protein